MSEEKNFVSYSYQEKLEAANLEAFAPKVVGHYRRTSDSTIDYNCLAWALENNQKWFDPQRFCAGYYWPKGIERVWSMKNILEVLTLYGYSERAEDGNPEVGYTKLAVYADEEKSPTHFARQLENGKWTSKAGELIDFEHDDLECLECEDYGKVNIILKKKA